MLAEAGILLGTASNTLPGKAFGCGFLTSATALGKPLIDRLHSRANITFTHVEALGELPEMVSWGRKGRVEGGKQK